MEKVRVTEPLLPDLDEFHELLKEIWKSKWITNYGEFHRQLEEELCRYLKVPYISLFSNGTLPLIAALKALNVTGEVITTPYTFVATSHSILWNNLTPVFVDVEPETGNINLDLIEEAITPATSAIMPVHVYGQPCDIFRIQKIADRHGLKVIYDAAHAFGVEKEGESVLKAGDLSACSFHATKVFNTIEGGALVMKDEQTKRHIDHLNDFGIESEIEINSLGINAKLDEMRSAYGLLNLKQVDAAIAKRQTITNLYRDALKDIDGISFLKEDGGVKYNYSYFPIFVDAQAYGTTRDELYEKMKTEGILARRYFHPLISNLPMYKHLPSASQDNLPEANKLADQVICLPLSPAVTEDVVGRVVEIILHL